MYQVIARKYRPQSFEDVVNQDHVKRTLVNALSQGRLGHGYIFSGPRGTGKTTLARILAKALNCEKGTGPTPCQQCASCQEIAAGNSLDLVEIDAASNRRIDDIRELRENVRYRPVRDRYKVFIIDEAHQITTDAFNALLKTLEEPPEWVVFVLCTTEPQAIPATIVSRCQTFAFRTVETDLVVERMRQICETESIEADSDALVAIALAGDGSIRDSLSTLDQAIGAFGNRLEAGPVRELLGAVPVERLEEILTALRDNNPQAMLKIVDDIFHEGRHPQHFCGELCRFFRNLLVMKVAGAGTRLVTAGAEERNRASQWLDSFSEEDLTRYLQLLLALYRDLHHAPQPRFRLEIGLLKLVYAGRVTSIEKVLSGLGGAEAQPDGGPAAAPKQTRSASSAQRSPGVANKQAHPAPQPAAAQPSRDREETAAETPSPTPSPGNPTTRLIAELRTAGEAFAAEALEHCQIGIHGQTVSIQAHEDYETLIEFSLPTIETAARRVLGPRARVTLGSAAAQTQAAADVSAGAPAANGPSSTARQELPSGEAAERALADPAVRHFLESIPGRVREVRNLRN